jgi:hypothetical protein
VCFQLLACLSLVLSPKCTSRQCRIERSHPKHRGPEIQKLASLQASSPDIRQTEIHRPRPVCASFHGHEKLKGAPPNGPMADQAGNKLVPRFHHNLYERITRLGFSLLFQAIKRNGVLTALSVSRSEQTAEQARRQKHRQRKSHTLVYQSLCGHCLHSPRGTGCGACHVSGEDGRRPSLPLSGNLGAVRTWELA